MPDFDLDGYRRAVIRDHDQAADHACCYHVAAAKAVLADRERELLEIKGTCRTEGCPLHYAHSGPCNMTTRPKPSGGDS